MPGSFRLAGLRRAMNQLTIPTANVRASRQPILSSTCFLNADRAEICRVPVV
jgi:hypothetical protein